MREVIRLIIILIVIISNSHSLQSRTDKLSNDLTGNTVQSSNEEQYWTFRNGEPLEYVIIDNKNLGTRKARRLYTIIYLRTRNSPNQEKRLCAEGLIELVYMKSRSGNQYYISHINQLGFKILALTKEMDETLTQLEAFWKEFQFAVSFNYKEKVADMIEFPLSTVNLGNYSNKADLMLNYEKMFTEVIRNSVENSILAPEPKSKGKKFDYDTDEYIQKCDFDSQVLINEHLNYFVVKKINGKFKLTGMKELN